MVTITGENLTCGRNRQQQEQEQEQEKEKELVHGATKRITVAMPNSKDLSIILDEDDGISACLLFLCSCKTWGSIGRQKKQRKKSCIRAVEHERNQVTPPKSGKHKEENYLSDSKRCGYHIKNTNEIDRTWPKGGGRRARANGHGREAKNDGFKDHPQWHAHVTRPTGQRLVCNGPVGRK